MDTGNQPTIAFFQDRAQYWEETVGSGINYKQDRDNSKEEKRSPGRRWGWEQENQEISERNTVLKQ